MTSLKEYVATQFPNHQIDQLDPHRPVDLELSDHTVVTQVVGAGEGLDVLCMFRRTAPDARVAALSIRPSQGKVIPHDDEDRDGVVDLPGRRVALAAVAGAAIVGTVLVAVMLIIRESAAIAAIVGGFGVMIGAAIGAIIGGSRLSSQRATMQPQAPGQPITVVAAFLDDAASATMLANAVGPRANFDVRIVDRRGGWRSPGTSRRTRFARRDPG